MVNVGESLLPENSIIPETPILVPVSLIWICARHAAFSHFPLKYSRRVEGSRLIEGNDGVEVAVQVAHIVGRLCGHWQLCRRPRA